MVVSVNQCHHSRPTGYKVPFDQDHFSLSNIQAFILEIAPMIISMHLSQKLSHLTQLSIALGPTSFVAAYPTLGRIHEQFLEVPVQDLASTWEKRGQPYDPSQNAWTTNSGALAPFIPAPIERQRPLAQAPSLIEGPRSYAPPTIQHAQEPPTSQVEQQLDIVVPPHPQQNFLPYLRLLQHVQDTTQQDLQAYFDDSSFLEFMRFGSLHRNQLNSHPHSNLPQHPYHPPQVVSPYHLVQNGQNPLRQSSLPNHSQGGNGPSHLSKFPNHPRGNGPTRQSNFPDHSQAENGPLQQANSAYHSQVTSGPLHQSKSPNHSQEAQELSPDKLELSDDCQDTYTHLKGALTSVEHSSLRAKPSSSRNNARFHPTKKSKRPVRGVLSFFAAEITKNWRWPGSPKETVYQWIMPLTRFSEMNPNGLESIASDLSKALPNPLWRGSDPVLPSSEAISTGEDEGFVRPLQIFPSSKRDMFCNMFNGRFQKIHSYVEEVLHKVPRNEQSRITSEDLPMCYTTHFMLGDKRSLFGYLQLAIKGNPTSWRMLRPRLRTLSQLSLFLYGRSLNMIKQRLDEERILKFIQWLSDKFTDLKTDLPLVGPTKRILKESMSENSFDDAQKLIMSALAAGKFSEIIDSASLSLAILFYKEVETNLWINKFKNSKDEFWHSMFVYLTMNIHIFDHPGRYKFDPVFWVNFKEKQAIDVVLARIDGELEQKSAESLSHVEK
ncbi:hypothetical protein O181_048418 [Austropuccinia psidii MF-1]|uniref:Uncharacterized protein n=1 Tax=Austropuccinia psidii MF-1 TaxID=1389203 RepID=A0A9Q3HKG9_9BASI|nr:hypothetical protein [Austropuccinia psidii MF-1]